MVLENLFNELPNVDVWDKFKKERLDPVPQPRSCATASILCQKGGGLSAVCLQFRGVFPSKIT